MKVIDIAPRRIVYNGRDVVVVSREMGQTKGIITFTPWSKNPPRLKRAELLRGFGEDVFLRDGIDELHVISRWNNWYQTAERDVVLGIAQEFSARRRALTYGSSMGGYGAALYSHLIGVPALCFSPQFSLHPQVVPFERRWLADRQKMPEFERGLMGRNRGPKGYVFYDPFYRLDAKQAALFRQQTDYKLIRCAFSGHPSTSMVNRSYGLKRAVNEILEDEFDVENFIRILRKNREIDPVYAARFYIKTNQDKRRQKPARLEKSKKMLSSIEASLSVMMLIDLFKNDHAAGNLKGADHWIELANRVRGKNAKHILALGYALKNNGRDADAVAAVRQILQMGGRRPKVLRLAQKWGREAVC